MAKNLINIISALHVSLIFILPVLAVDPISVFVSIAPQKFTVQQIGNDLVDVHSMVPPGASPHTYEPRPRQMVAMSKAQLYFGTGVGFERKWLQKLAAANPEMPPPTIAPTRR